MDHFYQDIVGYVGKGELDILRKGVQQTPDGGTIIEVGVCNGYCTAFLIVEIMNSGKDIKLISCDTFPDEWRERSVRSLAEGYNVEVVKGRSVDLDVKSADFVWLDGDHSYENVKEELIRFYDILTPGGMIAGHDYRHEYYPGVKKAVDEFCSERGITVKGGFSFYFTKDAQG